MTPSSLKEEPCAPARSATKDGAVKKEVNEAFSSVPLALLERFPPPPGGRRGGILGDEMGMGKSIQFSSLVCVRRAETPGPTLIVAPAGAVRQWEAEILKYFGPGVLKVYLYHGKHKITAPKLLEYDIVITTYQTLESEYRAELNELKERCEFCAELFLPEKLGSHKEGCSGGEDGDRRTGRGGDPRDYRIGEAELLGIFGVGTEGNESPRPCQPEWSAIGRPSASLMSSFRDLLFGESPVGRSRSESTPLPELKRGGDFINAYDQVASRRSTERDQGTASGVPRTGCRGRTDEDLTAKTARARDDNVENGSCLKKESSEVKGESPVVKGETPVVKGESTVVKGESTAVKSEPSGGRAGLSLRRTPSRKENVWNLNASRRGGKRLVLGLEGHRKTAKSYRSPPMTPQSRKEEGTLVSLEAEFTPYQSVDVIDLTEDVVEAEIVGGELPSDAGVCVKTDPVGGNPVKLDSICERRAYTSAVARDECRGATESSSPSVELKTPDKGSQVPSSVAKERRPRDPVLVQAGSGGSRLRPSTLKTILDVNVSLSMRGSGSNMLLHSIVWGRVCLDEAHRIRNRTTNTARAAFLRIRPLSTTGCDTAGCRCEVLDHPWDDECHECGHSKHAHYNYFNRFIARPIQKSGLTSIEGAEGMRMLRSQLLGKFLLRRTKAQRQSDVKLPPMEERPASSVLSAAEAAYYQAKYEKYRAQVVKYAKKGELAERVVEALKMILRLRQAANHKYLIEHRAQKEISCGICHQEIPPRTGCAGQALAKAKCDHLFHKYVCARFYHYSPQFLRAVVAPSPRTVLPGLSKQLEVWYGNPLCGDEEDETDDSIVEAVALRQLQNDPRVPRKASILKRVPISSFESSSKIEGLVAEVQAMRKADGEAKGRVTTLRDGDCDILDVSPLRDGDCDILDVSPLRDGDCDILDVSPLRDGDYVSPLRDGDCDILDVSPLRDGDCDILDVSPRLGNGDCDILDVSPLRDGDCDILDVLVFSCFVSLLELCQYRLHKAGITTLILHGELSLPLRSKVMKTFIESPADTCPLLLISLMSGGEGLNLQAANHIFLLDPWWNPAVEQQATQRAHRLGQSKRVQVVKMVTKDTIEERIVALQDKKRAVCRGIIRR
ncbi:hypothetical protein FOZ60_015544 [Perkinsus olseni]|uniref:DNA repair protein rad16 n=1 Tax=Perkinsus olseni TaxID=32597 RepID=A0A7J6P6D9_PEROL|nr:hypothetical protein FOZ60_015544 [Perkinsus olseni]